MSEILEAIDMMLSEGKSVCVATVVWTWGSSPRTVGAKMVVNQDGEMVGSVSGGCVEGAVVEEATQSLQNGQAKLLHYGVADEEAWGVGLACGGEIDVFLVPILNSDSFEASQYGRMLAYVNMELPFVLARVVQGPSPVFGQSILYSEKGETFGDMEHELREQVITRAQETMNVGSSCVEEHSCDGEAVDVFYEYRGRPLKLVIVGGVHIAIALATQARSLGYRVYVIDPRSAFGVESRFEEIDGLIDAWPGEGLRKVGVDSSTAVAVLTHDPKLDDPALKFALSSPAFYVGALGSQKTQKARRRRLLEAGVSEEQVDRLRGPIGLDLGGRSPSEIALSIMAEIVAVRHGTQAFQN
ncbi:MAG: hypothetical protein GTO18_08825 [Anaerolineales bacterium]|nr:hypothetical protein [Anaerolineales bacterium]